MNRAGEVVDDVLDRVRRAPDVTVLDPGDRLAWRPEPVHVWYVAYGSNLLRARFERYLLGGSMPHLDVVYPGGPGTAPAEADRAVVLPGSLRFAGDAAAWGGGGVCFWQPGADGAVLARAWRVTLRQYLEVVHLENTVARTPERRPAAWDPAVLHVGAAVVHDGWYGRVVVAGALDGEPALTFTAPDGGRPRERGPSPHYRDVVVAGLVETFGDPSRGGLRREEALGYVRAAIGPSTEGATPTTQVVEGRPR